MRRESIWRKPGLFAMVFALALMATLCALAQPATAMADERIGHSVDESGNETSYYDIASARNACYAGVTVVMDADWKFEKEDHFIVPNGKKVTLDMNGHRIDSNYLAFFLHEHSELVLTSSAKSTFKYKGYSAQDGNEIDVETTSGGLVKVTDNYSSAIQSAAYGTVTLDGVTIGGSRVTQDIRLTENGLGGVYLSGSSTLNMKNGASIEHNKAHWGAGVCAGSTNITINMENSSIHDNYSMENGGGIHCGEKGARINMTKGAKICNNTAGLGGGGIYFRYSNFSLKSEDRDAYVSGNRCLESSRTTTKSNQSGGGIHVDQREFESNEGLIEGITISENYSAYDAGGIELDQESTTVRDCTITDNWCKYEGGGIYVCNDRNTIDNCTITGNACSVDSGGNYEGGGVFVWHKYDIKMTGKCIVKGNTRGKDSGNVDDVMLREDSWSSTKAYITGNLSEGSSVGVRTGTTGDRRVAKSFKPESNDCLFYDLDGYYISYGTDEGGDAWQRHTTKEFTVKVSGEAAGKYRNGTSVALSVPAAKDGKAFWRWDAKSTSGLYPLEDYITGKGLFSNAVAFTMPQNDVNLMPLYVDRVKSALFAVQAPEAGKPLSTSGQLVRTDDGASGSATAPCSVYWYEVGENGEETYVVGNAKANTTYKAYVSAPEAAVLGLFYDDAIKAQNVTVRLVSPSGETKAEGAPDDAYVTLSNSLAAKTAKYATGSEAGKESKTGTVDVQLKGKALVGGTEAATASLALDGGADGHGQANDAGSIGTVQISYGYDNDSDTVSIAVPAMERYNFCNWDGVPESIGVDDESGTLTAPVSELLGIESLTAVYTPIATALEVELDAPVAGDDLAATCADIQAACSDGETVSLAEGFGADSFEVSWSPEPAGGKAGYSTAYTALIKLSDDAGFEDVEDVLDRDAAVTCNGVRAESAGFALLDGGLYLCVSFPATADAKVTGISQPADVELSFEQAKACASEGSWPLPGSVDVSVESGVAAEGDVDWQAVEGFDEGATGAQELAAHGTVTRIVTADDSEIDTTGASLDVSTTIKVTAPAQGGDDPSSGANADGDKSALAKTGDSIPVFAVAAVAVIAIAAIAVAIVAARRNRRQ